VGFVWLCRLCDPQLAVPAMVYVPSAAGHAGEGAAVEVAGGAVAAVEGDQTLLLADSRFILDTDRRSAQ
jgi:hypothetical protein